ncbi:BTB/POZ domain-containing protein [Tanacetum coccineum]
MLLTLWDMKGCDYACLHGNVPDDLVRRIGSQSDLVTLNDLLIPSLKSKDDTLFDVDVVHRIWLTFCSKMIVQMKWKTMTVMVRSNGPDSLS